MYKQTLLEDTPQGDVPGEDTTRGDSLSEDNPEKLYSIITDLSKPENYRLECLNKYYSLKPEETFEVVNKLCIMYEFSYVSSLRKYLTQIGLQSKLPPLMKGTIANSLYCQDSQDSGSYRIVDAIFPVLGDDIATPYKLDLLGILIENKDYEPSVKKYLTGIVSSEKLECEYRFNLISKLECGRYSDREESEEEDSREDSAIRHLRKMYVEYCYLEFLMNIRNNIRLRILAAQSLYSRKASTEQAEKCLLEIAETKSDLPDTYNTRADAADVLLQFGSEEAKLRASDVITELSSSDNTGSFMPLKGKVIYTNAQNVHLKEIGESVFQALEFLQKYQLAKVNGKYIDFEYVKNTILEMSTGDSRLSSIKISLSRIFMDTALYGKYFCTLKHILLQVWTYTTGHKHEVELRKRLLEELADMSGTCSSGFAARLVNTISGFGDFNISISWRDQISANLLGRLNAKIRDMDNLALQEKILAQMMYMPSKAREIEGKEEEVPERKHFLKFLRENISELREELSEEFKEYLSVEEFDKYFRDALYAYEIGEKSV